MYTAHPQAERTVIQRRMTTALLAVLPHSVSAEVLVGDDRHDAIVRIGPHKLSARWIGRGGLREIKVVLKSRDRPDLIICSHLSLVARTAASDAGLSWIDETGAAEIVVGDILVSRSGTRARPPIANSRWTTTVLGVAEALLCGVAPTVEATASATGHSASSTARALAFLTDRHLLEAPASRGRNSGRQVADKSRLLDEYAAAASQRRSKLEIRCGVLWQTPIETMEKMGEIWSQAGTDWAITGVMAAAVLAPYLTELTNGEVYVEAKSEPDLLFAANQVGITPMAGGRLVLRPFPTASSRRLASEINGLVIAPWPRVYADVREVGVRGEEAAEHLREVVNG